MLFTKDGKSIRRRVLALALIGVMIIPAVAIAQNAKEQPIVDIKISGNDHVSSEAIMAALSLKPGMNFSEAAIQQAKQSIESMGYFQPGVTVGTESVTGGVRAIFNVVENPVVKAINITGNTVEPTDKLMSLLRTSVGSVLNTDTLLQKDVRAIENFYEEQGYIAYVTENIGIDPKTGVLNIPINEVKIENIKITGNKKTKPEVILREMRQKPGQVYNVKTLHADLQRIYDLDIFELESASSYKTEPGSDLGKVNIIIPVKEKKTGEVSVGLGYSSKNKLVGQAKLSENNFRGRAEKVNLLWEQSGDLGSSYEAGFYEPWLDSRNTSLGVNVYDKRIYRFSSSQALGGIGYDTGNASNYDEQRRGGSVTLSRPLSLMTRGFMTLRAEDVRSDVAHIASSNVPFNLMQGATVFSGTGRFTADTRDSLLDPFMGSYVSTALEMGNVSFNKKTLGAALPTDISNAFAKYSVDLRKYLSKGGPRQDFNEKRKRVALRLMGGATTGMVPFSEQYFVGGAESLRGYKEDRFWGKYMFLASAEYRVPVASSLTGVAFVDYGDAWGAPIEYRKVVGVDANGNPGVTDLIQNFTQHENFSPSAGYGFGIRVNTPLGPLRLDYGFGKEGSRAHFSIGQVF